MKNQKKRFIPSPPNGPARGNMPGKLQKMTAGKKTKELPEKPEMPNVGFRGFKMVDDMKKQLWNHHKKFHLDANGDFKPKLKEKGLKLMKKFMG